MNATGTVTSTHDAYRPSTRPDLWGTHPSPVAHVGPPIAGNREDGRDTSLSVRTWAVCSVAMALILLVSAVAGWLWPL